MSGAGESRRDKVLRTIYSRVDLDYGAELAATICGDPVSH